MFFVCSNCGKKSKEISGKELPDGWFKCEFECDLCGEKEKEVHYDIDYSAYSKPPKGWFYVYVHGSVSESVSNESDETNESQRVLCCSKDCVERALEEFSKNLIGSV